MKAEVKSRMRNALPTDVTYGNPIIAWQFTVPASLSMVGCALVVLTYVLWPELRRVRYIEIMFYVAGNLFIASLGGALGPVPNYSPACWFQGISTNVNFVISSLWTCVLSFQLWYAVVYGRTVKNMFYTHLFIWTVPLIFALLPLSTNTYGNPGGYKDNKESSWCFIVTSTDDDDAKLNRRNETDDQVKIEIIWIFLSFYGFIYASLLLNAFFAFTIIFRINEDKNRTLEIKKSVWRLLIYPFVDLVCWTYTFVVDLQMSLETNRGKSSDGDLASNSVPLLSGFLFSVAFFYINATARTKWKRLFEKLRNRMNGVKDDVSRRISRYSINPMAINIAALTTTEEMPLPTYRPNTQQEVQQVQEESEKEVESRAAPASSSSSSAAAAAAAAAAPAAAPPHPPPPPPPTSTQTNKNFHSPEGEGTHDDQQSILPPSSPQDEVYVSYESVHPSSSL